MMKPSGRMILLVAPIFAAAFVLVAGCEHFDNDDNLAKGKKGSKGGKNVCYERVLNVDKETGKASYEERVVPCKK